MTTPWRALALVCSLKPSPAPSSSDLIARQVHLDLEQTPSVPAVTNANVAASAAFLARLLKDAPYPPQASWLLALPVRAADRRRRLLHRSP